MGLRLAFILVPIAGMVSGVPADDVLFPGDPPQAQLPAASPPSPIPPPAGKGQVFPIRCRFYHDRDVRVIGAALIFLAGAFNLLPKSQKSGIRSQESEAPIWEF